MAQNNGAGFATASELLQIYRLTGSRSAALPALARLSSFNTSLPCPNADANYDMLVFVESTAGAERAHWWNCTLKAAASLLSDAHGHPYAASQYILRPTHRLSLVLSPSLSLSLSLSLSVCVYVCVCVCVHVALTLSASGTSAQTPTSSYRSSS